MGHDRKTFVWESWMTGVTALLVLFLMLVQTWDTVRGWMVTPVLQSQKVTSIDEAQNIATVQISSFIKENSLAHNQILQSQNMMKTEFESKIGQVNENIAYMRGLLDRAFPTNNNKTSWVMPDIESKEKGDIQ